MILCHFILEVIGRLGFFIYIFDSYNLINIQLTSTLYMSKSVSYFHGS